MDLLSDETEVFDAGDDGRCGVVFLARRVVCDAAATRRVLETLESLRSEGWAVSLDQILASRAGQVPPSNPFVFETGFTHDRDIAGIFEAPSLEAAHAGVARLEQAGWIQVLRTEWLIGPREFLPVISRNSRNSDDWAFFALWTWKDAWHSASDEQRRAYDLECDTAFDSDLRLGAAISGRHRLDVASRWDHIGVWRVPGPDMVDEAMRAHAAVADFKYTTSRHYLGRRISLATALSDAVRETA